ncbi:MAG: hypothetical protein L6R41_006591 [Letrouitia leprolyta]|nr:MAG: hypothetical protein L6R41_006591 [Letrouitia leprolyta]
MDSVQHQEQGPSVVGHHMSLRANKNSFSTRGNLQPPKYTIDLSLPPAERFKQVATDFKSEISALPALFDELVRNLLPQISVGKVQSFARLFLRRLYSNEETEEIRGIHEVTGIEMYLLVSYNVLLDLFMGCTSGGIQIKDGSDPARMLHFRTLDWGMDPLRKVVVCLDFVEKPGGPVIASTISYIGFVGVLTGVKKGLSVSLNFRPNHIINSRFSNLRYYSHHVLVLLGFQPPIASILRQCIIPSEHPLSNVECSATSLDQITKSVPSMKTTASYLIFCDGTKTVTMEKDHRTAYVRSSNDFIIACNHDQVQGSERTSNDAQSSTPDDALKFTGMDMLVEESTSRQDKLTGLWARVAAKNDTVTTRKLKGWISKYPITNEETHFATILDPIAGTIAWVQRYLEPIA